jgi:lipopolysaccharide assembly protein A
MSVLYRNRNAPAEPVSAAPPQAMAPPPAVPSAPAARTRTSAAWVGICLAVAVLAVLIVFLLQNTGSVEVTFLWMHGSLPLAIALLIAGVGASLLTMTVGAARITQLRRRFRRHP